MTDQYKECSRCKEMVHKSGLVWRSADGVSLRDRPVCTKCHEDMVKGVGRGRFGGACVGRHNVAGVQPGRSDRQYEG